MESNAYRVIKYVEEIVVKYFKIENKQAMMNHLDEVCLIDATEIKIEYPKKNNQNIIQ